MSYRTQKEIVLDFLSNGNTLSVNQAKKSFRIGNVYEVVRRLRMDGNAIYTNRNASGKAVYRLGNPRKSAVAFQYAIHGAGAFE